MDSSVEHDLVFVDEFDALAIDVKDAVGSKYPAKAHARRVASQLGVDHGLIYLPGQVSLLWEDSDMGPDFRQRRFFYYMTGSNVPGCAVTYDIKADLLVLWIPYTPPSHILWFGRTPGPDECMDRSDVDAVKYIAGLDRYLLPVLPVIRKLFVLAESQLPPLLQFVPTYKSGLTIDTTSLRPAIAEARVIKSDYEVAMIRKANQVSSAAHLAVCRKFRTFRNECEVAATFEAACLAANSHAQSYAIIAGSGRNAATLHYGANNEPLEGRQVVVLDAGAEWNCYASDITRTLPVDGRFTPEGRAVYDLVERMQRECIERIRPGTRFYQLALHAHRVATEGLLALGILHNGSADEVFESGTSAAFLPHGLGHHVGLEVHDEDGEEHLYRAEHPAVRRHAMTLLTAVALQDMIQASTSTSTSTSASASGPDSSAQPRGRRELEKNMIVTIEPGIYFCKEYIESYFLSKKKHAKYINTDVLDKYWDVGGVRLEDCILVTDDGYENLSTAPKGDEMLDIINGK